MARITANTDNKAVNTGLSVFNHLSIFIPPKTPISIMAII